MTTTTIEPTTTSVEVSATTARPPRARSSRSEAVPVRVVKDAGGAVLVVQSTAYCESGGMANGQRAFAGAVAMNGVPFGTRYRVLDGPAADRVFVVADRYGHGTAFDIAMPGDCAAARAYGRRTIRIERVE